MPRVLYIVAGELSGDSRGAELMSALRGKGGDFEFRGAGGPRMRAVPGAEKVIDWVEEAAIVGLWEVLRNYGYFRGEFGRIRAEVNASPPDAVILIDYPGFNLRLAKTLRRDRLDLKIIYYVSPQVWAWNRGRVREMARTLDLMICIFPFEKEIYERSGLRTVFAGHPLVDEIASQRGCFEREENLVGLFPGSRSREVDSLFPPMLEAALLIKKESPDVRFMASAASVPLARGMRRLVEESPLMGELDCEVVRGRSWEVMQRACCGVIASGTATLEAAFFGLPYCLVYKVAWPTYVAARALMKVDHLGIVNILAGRPVIQEITQGDVTPERIAGQVRSFLNSREARENMAAELAQEVGKLGGGGAAARAAEAVLVTVYPGAATGE